MSNVGYATLTIIPSAKGFAKALGGQVDAPMTGLGKSGGAKAGGAFVGAFKGLVGPAVALAGAGMFAGFIGEAARASDATDKFKATMSFAGLNTKAIDAATAAAKGYADQTVYDLPTIQNMIAQLASNGVKDYTGLTKAAGNLNAVAGGNADTFKSVAMVMTQTAGAGKLTTENWNQLSDAIPGAAGPLMKAMQDAGAYTGNFRDAMAAGEITSEEFNAALMKLGTKPVAVEAAKSTKTFEGAIGNLQATINSGLMGALNALKPAITGAINLLSNGLGKAFEWTGKAASGLISLFSKGDFTGALREAFNVEEDSPLVNSLFKIRDNAIMAKGALVGAFQNGDVTSDGWVGLIERIGVGLREGVGGVKAFFAAFKAGDGEVTSSGFAGFLERMGGLARQAFDAIGPAISGIVPQVVSLITSFSPLSLLFQALEPVLPALATALGQLGSTISGVLGVALTYAAPLVQQLVTHLSGVFMAAMPAVVQIIGLLGNAFATLAPVIMNVFNAIMPLVFSLLNQLSPIITSFVTSIMPPVVTIFGAVVSAIGPLITTITGLLVPVIQALMPVVVTVFGVVSNVITTAMQVVQGVIQVVTGIISGNWSQVWTGISNVFSGIWATIGAVLSGALSIARSAIQGALSIISTLWSGAWNGISSFLSDAWGRITGAVSDNIGKVVGFFSGLIGRITGAIGNAGSALWSTGQQIIQGLIDGIGSMMGSIGRAVINIVPEAIRGPFETLLGIHSPSRVFRGYGVNIGQGLVLGIRDQYADVEKAVSGMVTTTPTVPAPQIEGGGIQGALATVAGAVQAGGSPLIGSLTLQSSGNVRQDLDETMFHVRRIARGGVHA